MAFLPNDTLDVDEDGDTAEDLPQDIVAGERIVTNLDIGAYEHPSSSPTAVVLNYFEATVDGMTVTLAWETASEVNHAGFNVYRRAANSRDAWVLCNDQLIASHGTQAQGAIYQYADDDVNAGIWEYLLEDVATDGETYRHEDATATATVQTPTTVTLTMYAAVGYASMTLFAQFVTLLLLTVGVVIKKWGNEGEASHSLAGEC